MRVLNLRLHGELETSLRRHGTTFDDESPSDHGGGSQTDWHELVTRKARGGRVEGGGQRPLRLINSCRRTERLTTACGPSESKVDGRQIAPCCPTDIVHDSDPQSLNNGRRFLHHFSASSYVRVLGALLVHLALDAGEGLEDVRDSCKGSTRPFRAKHHDIRCSGSGRFHLGPRVPSHTSLLVARGQVAFRRVTT